MDALDVRWPVYATMPSSPTFKMLIPSEHLRLLINASSGLAAIVLARIYSFVSEGWRIRSIVAKHKRDGRVSGPAILWLSTSNQLTRDMILSQCHHGTRLGHMLAAKSCLCLPGAS